MSLEDDARRINTAQIEADRALARKYAALIDEFVTWFKKSGIQPVTIYMSTSEEYYDSTIDVVTDVVLAEGWPFPAFIKSSRRLALLTNYTTMISRTHKTGNHNGRDSAFSLRPFELTARLTVEDVRSGMLEYMRPRTQ